MADDYVNFFSGSPLNRLSWLRTSEPFLNSIVTSSKTRWLLLNGGQPLLATNTSTQKRSLARLTTADVRPLLGLEPYFAQGEKLGSAAEPGVPALEASRFHGPPIVFLGLHETQTSLANALPSSDFTGKGGDAVAVADKIEGTPYFSLDVSDVSKEDVDHVLKGAEQTKEGAHLAFSDARVAMGSLDDFEAAVYAEARSMLDWQARNKFCPACGSPVKPLWAGWKLICTSILPWAQKRDKPCPSATGLNNFAHPRTDTVVIMAPIDQTGNKMLLGRNRKWPHRFYSALAGFIEPGESLEDAVRRELWEEAGVQVWGVKYHSTQPWPYPANLMAGFYAIADSSKPLRTDLDNELQDARWYTRDEILHVLSLADGSITTGTDPTKPIEQPDTGTANASATAVTGSANPLAGDAVTDAEKRAAAKPEGQGGGEAPFKIPPKTAIAGVLIREWALGRAGPNIGGSVQGQAPKGNL